MKKKIKSILKKINYIKIIIVELYIVIAQLIWHCKDYLIGLVVPIPPIKLQDKLFYLIFNSGVAVGLTSLLIALIIKLKRPNNKKEEKGMEDIKLKNGNNEYPRCIKIINNEEEDLFTYVFDAKNISLDKMLKNRDGLESIHNIKIYYMEYGKNTKYINVYATPREMLKPKLFEVSKSDHFLDDFLSALVVGSTGSGKTYFTYQLLGKITYNKTLNSQNGEDVKVFICDRKNEDFLQFKNYPNYYGVNAVDGIRKVHEIFTERLNNEENNNNKETIICLIEEYALLLKMLDKKEAEEIKNMVADLLFAGRSKKIITIISLQRADAIYFPQGAKEQFKKIIMMGQISQIQLDMLLDEELQEQITEVNKQGYGYLYEDGNRKLTRIKVAEISPKEKNFIDEIISSKMW